MFPLGASAQVIVLNDNMFTGRLSEIKATVLDSLTNEPVPYASVYVIPSKDTVITNFTLSDAEGVAKLDEVPYGSYVFHVEMMGYKPFVKEKYFRERREDMGTIRLQVDEQFLQAAVVSDVGNPIVIKQDTVEFNASSYRVGANAMLKDLLRRMPGMEITDDGKVKFNGESIDKLTVGGRTFFFNDQSTALNNLPASVVDKIRVIDRESESTRASGIQDGSKEKVLDVSLKKEYEKGWFGNVGAKGGTTIVPKDDEEPLRDNRGFLYSGNALVSAYSEKDQITVIANGQNVNDSNNVVMVIVNGERADRASLDPGLSSSAQFGINANTSRIKDVETTAAINYKYTDTDSGSKTARTTYLDSGDLNSTSERNGKQYSNSVGGSLEFQKEKGSVWFHIRPDVSYSHSNSYSKSSSRTTREEALINSTENTSSNLSVNKDASFDADVTFRDLWGKSKRSLALSADASYRNNTGHSEESSDLSYAVGNDKRDMNYDSDGHTYGVGGSIRYTEPLGEKITLSALADVHWSAGNSVRDAFDANGRNDYYSSSSRSNYFSQLYDITAQYTFAERSYITVGARVSGILNETFSKSYGIDTVTGENDWNWYVTPTLRFMSFKGNDRFNASVSGRSQRPSSSNMLPVLNITDQSRLSLGNIYLKPYSNTNFNVSWTNNDRSRFTNLMIFLYGAITSSPISNALWYDSDGIMYSIPVNSRKPGLNGSFLVNYTTPLDKEKNWSLSFNGSIGAASTYSYQTRSNLPGIDKDKFDYSTFMSTFWGDGTGDLFYSGKSGFSESNTLSFNPSGGLSIKYNQDHYWFSAGVTTMGRISRYSLDPSVNMNTLETYISAQGSYTTKHEFEFNTDISYVFYNGYAEGYGDPEWQWNAEVSKNIGAFNLSIKVNDILNQTRSLSRDVTANYSEDSYRLIMGRYILFGVKWNFGKMNASHSRNAQNAAWNMIF